MLVFKILQRFLSPSVFTFFLILAGLVILLRLKKEKTGRSLVVAGVLLCYLFSITPAVDLILTPLERQYPQIQERETGRTNYLVLLLGSEKDNILRSSEVLRIYFEKLEEFKGINSSKNAGEFKIIISGVSPISPEKNNAKKVKEYLSKRGIAIENIILEEESRNTFESAKNIQKILGKEPLLLVTSAYHMPRAMEIFQKMDMRPIPAPADFKKGEGYNVLDLFPDPKNMVNSNLAFHEYFGILFYRLCYR